MYKMLFNSTFKMSNVKKKSHVLLQSEYQFYELQKPDLVFSTLIIDFTGKLKRPSHQDFRGLNITRTKVPSILYFEFRSRSRSVKNTLCMLWKAILYNEVKTQPI